MEVFVRHYAAISRNPVHAFLPNDFAGLRVRPFPPAFYQRVSGTARERPTVNTIRLEQTNVIATIERDVGYLTLNNPDALNALSPDTLRSICDCANWISQQEAMRVCIVRGLGRAFCAGADLPEYLKLSGLDLVHAVDLGRLAAEAIEKIPVISICEIQGWCVGGGIVLASSCDLRIAESNASFQIPEVDIGLPLAWSGVPRLLREIGPARAKELIVTGRRFDADEAERIGFLNKVTSLEKMSDEVRKIASEVAKKPSPAVVTTKAHVNSLLNEMVSTRESWRDAHGLVSCLLDPESVTARDEYAKTKTPRNS